MQLEPLFSENEIKAIIKTYAQKYNQLYQGHKLILIGVLTGAIIFMADLMRELELDVTVDFIKISSYQGDQQKILKITYEPTVEIKNCDVLVVDDIYDGGKTAAAIYKLLQTYQPKSVRMAFLVWRQRHYADWVKPDYFDFLLTATKSDFLVGYGIDYNEQYRNRRSIYYLKK